MREKQRLSDRPGRPSKKRNMQPINDSQAYSVVL